MKNKRKLGNKKIYIDHDLSRKEREIQKEMVQWAKTERSNGKMVKIGFHKVLVEGKWINWQIIKRMDV